MEGSAAYTTGDGTSALLSANMKIAPLAQVVFAVTTSNPDLASVEPDSLIFTSTNYDKAQVLVVTGVINHQTVDSTYDVQIVLVATEDTFYSNLHAGTHINFPMTSLRKLQDRLSIDMVFGNVDPGLVEVKDRSKSCDVSENTTEACGVVITLVDSYDGTELSPGQLEVLQLDAVYFELQVSDETELTLISGGAYQTDGFRSTSTMSIDADGTRAQPIPMFKNAQ